MVSLIAVKISYYNIRLWNMTCTGRNLVSAWLQLMHFCCNYLTSPNMGCLSWIFLKPSNNVSPTHLALLISFSLCITSNTARPIAHETGLPPYYGKENDKTVHMMNFAKTIPGYEVTLSKQVKQESIPVGCVPPASHLYPVVYHVPCIGSGVGGWIPTSLDKPTSGGVGWVPTPSGQTETCAHYLPATSFAGGNNTKGKKHIYRSIKFSESVGNFFRRYDHSHRMSITEGFTTGDYVRNHICRKKYYSAGENATTIACHEKAGVAHCRESGDQCTIVSNHRRFVKDLEALTKWADEF